MPYRIQAPDKSIEGQIHLPGSKSIANRLLLMRALSGQSFPLINLPGCDDTLLMTRLLDTISHSVKGAATRDPVILDCGNTGTALRFLLPYLCLLPGRWILTGTERMKQRPMGSLVHAMRSLGARVAFIEKEGFPPVQIHGRLLEGGSVSLDPSESSQFVSALLMIAPILDKGMELRLSKTPVSEPYIDLTLDLMHQLGIKVLHGEGVYHIRPQRYKTKSFTVEADWSAASYWFEITALAREANIRLSGLSEHSFQGDRQVRTYFKHLGVTSGFQQDSLLLQKQEMPQGKTLSPLTFHMSDHPDLVPAVAVTSALTGHHVHILGIRHLRIKESDRIQSLVTELAKTGRMIKDGEDSIEIRGGGQSEFGLDFGVLRTYGDHRMAMALAPLALKCGSVTLDDISVVSKSYPGFWKDLEDVGFVITFTA